MYIDSHCHINFPELASRLPEVLGKMADNSVSHALCVSVDLPDFPQVLDLAEKHPHIYASVGVHPDYEETPEPTVEELVRLSNNPKIIAIGETGLDYYRLQGDLEWQRERFRTHIRASRATGKPLIIHTRSASEDTIRIMREEGAGTEAGGAGGVMLLYRVPGGCRSGDGNGFLHFLFRHCHLQECQGIAGGRACRAARTHVDRD
jgi:TatD DNase family protein